MSISPAGLSGGSSAAKRQKREVIVSSLQAGGNAQKAGLTVGDVILEVNGKLVSGRTLGEITPDLNEGEASSTVRITARRGQQMMTFTVARGFVRST